MDGSDYIFLAIDDDIIGANRSVFLRDFEFSYTEQVEL